MLTLDQCRLSQFAILLAEIEFSLFTGRVNCNSADGDCELYFSEGALRYAQSIGHNQSGEDVIYKLLNWKNGILSLESGIQTTEQNLDDMEASSWREAVRIFQSRGIFEKSVTPSPALLLAENPTWIFSASAKQPFDDYTTDFVSVGLKQVDKNPEATLMDQADEARNDNNCHPSVEALHQLVMWNGGLKLTEGIGTTPPESTFTETHQSPKFVEANLLLPEGLLQRQLLKLLSFLDFEKQLAFLQQLCFTGYVYYGLSENSKAENKKGDYGLVLFLEGCPTDVVYYDGRTETQQTGSQASRTLTSFKRLIPEVYKVEARILKAYRALVNGEQPYKNVRITGTAFAGVVEAFSQSQRDGVALLYVESLKLYYFFLFEGGTRIGVFSPDFQVGHLQQLTLPLALPACNTEVVLTVMLANPSDFKSCLDWPILDVSSVGSVISPNKPKVEGFQNDTQTFKVLDEPAAVEWGDLFNLNRFPVGFASSERYT